jgi:hypothetical protein
VPAADEDVQGTVTGSLRDGTPITVVPVSKLWGR